MNLDINEMEFYPVARISQISSYDAKLLDGEKDNDLYKTIIMVDLAYYDNEFNEQKTEIKLPIELSLGDKEIISLEINSINIQVIDNQGINIEYDLKLEVSDVVEVINFTENTEVNDFSIVENIEETKEQIAETYENLVESTGIREELPISYIETEEFSLNELSDDFMSVKVLFNIDVDNVDKIAFKHNLSIDECYKKITKDKTRLII